MNEPKGLRPLTVCCLSFSLLASSLLAVSAPVYAGTLGEFEQQARSSKQESDAETDQTDADDSAEQTGDSRDCYTSYDDACEDTADDESLALMRLSLELAYQLAKAGLELGGSWSMARMPGSDPLDLFADNQVPRRQPGELGLPYLALDSGYQWLGDDITAWDGRLELGYGLLGLESRYVRLNEPGAGDSLSMRWLHPLYRMSFSEYFELAIGLGVAGLHGQQSTSGLGFTNSWRIRTSDIVYLQGSSSSMLFEEGDASQITVEAAFAAPYGALRLGYRWYQAGSMTLSGPTLGLTLSY